jgi:hypothetical protein
MEHVRRGELAIALVLVLIALTALLYVLASFPGREKIYPAGLFFLLGGFSLIQLGKLIIALRSEERGQQEKNSKSTASGTSRGSRIWMVVGASAVYLLSIGLLGFSLASFLFILAFAWTLGYRKILVVLVVDLLIIASVHLLFIRLHVPVPEGIIWEFFS